MINIILHFTHHILSTIQDPGFYHYDKIPGLGTTRSHEAKIFI